MDWTVSHLRPGVTSLKGPNKPVPKGTSIRPSPLHFLTFCLIYSYWYYLILRSARKRKDEQISHAMGEGR